MGSVGTGKSSFLSAVLAELKKESGVIALSDLDGGERVRSAINHGFSLQRFGYNLRGVHVGLIISCIFYVCLLFI
jgi:ABC-type branched-subunit amino acid transport system ATPase component